MACSAGLSCAGTGRRGRAFSALRGRNNFVNFFIVGYCEDHQRRGVWQAQRISHRRDCEVAVRHRLVELIIRKIDEVSITPGIHFV
jgi:hypothetical protein